MAIFETSASDFKFFCDAVLYWMERFGVTDWDVTFAHIRCKGIYAKVTYDVAGRQCEFVLDKKWPEQPTPWHLDRTALHEVKELELAKIRESTKSQRDEEAHVIIRRWENYLFGLCPPENPPQNYEHPVVAPQFKHR